MITFHFHLQPQYKYELFHINFITHTMSGHRNNTMLVLNQFPHSPDFPGLIIKPQQCLNDFCHNFLIWLSFDILKEITKHVLLKNSNFKCERHVAQESLLSLNSVNIFLKLTRCLSRSQTFWQTPRVLFFFLS